MSEALPIAQIIPQLIASLSRTPFALVHAPTGSGKSTALPLALLQAPWLRLNDQKIILLQPRRLAAYAIAQRMADLIGEPLGQTVGYKIRLEERASSATRLLVVTEGILTAMLQSDPTLEGYGVVLFDEFHERSLAGDLALTLCREAQALFRTDLRMVLLSATPDVEAAQRFFSELPVLSSEGRTFPIEIRYLGAPQGYLAEAVAAAIMRAVREEEGSLLVFLPGMREIKHVEERLRGLDVSKGNVDILPLHGQLPKEAQRRALLPSPSGRRKIVLATNVAETSVTIEGIRLVIDAGLARANRFSPASGMNRLETVPISKASAEQRAGRAGRLSPGLCYRLWTARDQEQKQNREIPEIYQTDLAPLALDIAAWGAQDWRDLRWLDPPPDGAWKQACALLVSLGAIEHSTTGMRLTAHGKSIHVCGVHPRLGHMMLHSGGQRACDLAALLSERDSYRGRERDVDLCNRMHALEVYRAGHQLRDFDKATLERAIEQSDRWYSLVRKVKARGESPAPADSLADIGELLALAYPDRVAQRRDARGAYLLSNGRGATLDERDALAGEPYLAVAEIDDAKPHGRILLAAPLPAAAILVGKLGVCTEERIVSWNPEMASVIARREQRFGSLIVQSTPWTDAPAELIHACLLDKLSEGKFSALNWTQQALQWRERLAFLAHVLPEQWRALDDASLLMLLREYLDCGAAPIVRLADLGKIDLHSLMQTSLSREQCTELDRLAPVSISLPSGNRANIDYTDPETPKASARLQELFGMQQTPVLAGAVSLTLQLLSPGQRPIQVTRDLQNFWRTTYKEVRKELYGRYPRHYWPEDPYTAEATAKTKKRMDRERAGGN